MFNEIYFTNKRKILFLLLVSLITILAINMIETASAKDINVNPNTSGGLKKVIEKAETGDTIIMANGVYSGANNRGIMIDKSINIQGKGKNVEINAQGQDKVFLILTNKVSLKNLKITNGNYGVFSVNTTSLTITNCTFTNNKANFGGAIYSYGGTKLTVDKCTFTNNKNSAIIFGYGNVSGSHVIIKNSIFNKNQGNIGGAIAYGSNGNLTIKNCAFTSNKVQNNGGAINILGARNVAITKSTFNNNQAKSAGAIKHDSAGIFTLTSCVFTSNKAQDVGAILSSTKSGKITNSKFNNNIGGKKYVSIKGTFTRNNVKITPKDGTKVK